MSSTPGGSTSPQHEGSNNTPEGRPFPIFWSDFPSIKIVRQPKGRYSPQVDERCFTYCSQTVIGRTEQREPWCRTICLRRVFAHEVTRTIAAHNSQKSAAEASYPLPPEGQHLPGLSDILTSESEEDQPRHKDPEELRHWEEGFYLWLSANRWAMQEKLDLMSYNLERQAMWQRYKQQMVEKWQQQERTRTLQASQQPVKDAEVESEAIQRSPPPQQSTAQPVDPAFQRRPFPDLTADSILLPIPPPFPPIREQISNLLAPTHRLMTLTHESVQSGAQWKFMQRIWEKARTDEPFVLARNVCTRMWDNWKKGPPDDSL